MSGSKRTTFVEIIRAAMGSAMADTYHALPGIVVAYYPTEQAADVRIALDDPRFDPDTDERADEPWAIYPKMRVAWPRFGGFTICGPLAPGNAVQVFFQDLDDSKFRATGQPGPPQNTRRFGADAAFCVPWDLTDAGVAADAAAAGTVMIVGKDGDQAQVRVSAGTIQLGATGGDFAALASKVETELGKIGAILDSLQCPNTGTGTPVPVAGTGSPYGTPGAVGSTLIKAQ